MNEYKHLNLWCQQAHTYVDQKDGDKLINLDSDQQLIPYDTPSRLSSFLGWTVERHTAPLKRSFNLLATEAERLGHQVGIYSRIPEKLEDKDLDELTFGQLSTRLDSLLISPQIQLVKAKAAFDQVCDECERYIQGDITKGNPMQAFPKFKEELKEVYQALNQANNNPRQNLQYLKQLLQHDIEQKQSNAQGEEKFYAGQIKSVFEQFINTHEREPVRAGQLSGPALLPTSEQGMQQRYQQMLTDLRDTSQHGEELNQRIKDLARDTREFVTRSQNPSQALQMVIDSHQRQMKIIESENYVLEYSTQPIHKVIAEMTEYASLSQLIPRDRMTDPGFTPALQAFRQAQAFNSSLTNRHFATMFQYWNREEMNTWATQINTASQSQNRYYEMLTSIQDIFRLLVNLEEGMPADYVELVTQLDINALSTPYLLDQFRALKCLNQQQGPDFSPLSPKDMVYAINKNLLVPFHIRETLENPQNPRVLQRKLRVLKQQIRKDISDTAQIKATYNEPSAQQFFRRYQVAPFPITTNGDCFYSAVGHFYNEPMRLVRRRCHQAAQDIIAASKGEYTGSSDPGYDQRIRNAAKNVDLKRLQGKCDNDIYLIPSFERQDKISAWGEDDDMALVAVIYGFPVVPISLEYDCRDISGFGINGDSVWDMDSPDAIGKLTKASGRAPIMFYHTGDHWEPLVADR